MNPESPRDYCPRCGTAYEPLQEYCLECGARLPTNRGVTGVLASRWQRRLAWYPGDWIWPVVFLGALAIGAAAVVLVVNATRSSASAPLTATTAIPLGLGATGSRVPVATTSTLPNAPQPTITTGPLPAAPGAPSTSAVTTNGKPAKTNPNALTVWPAGKSGFTLVLESVPIASGSANAVARARRAKRAGLPSVGVLLSTGYSSLHPGYYVVFSGVYPTAAQASAAVAAAHAKGYPDAYQTGVTH